MLFTLSQSLKQRFTDYTETSFWVWNSAYWVFMCVVSFLTLSLWYGQLEWAYIGHTLVQALIGFVLSIPLYLIFIKIWNVRVAVRASLGLLAAAAIAFIWTMARLKMFEMMTVEENVWQDFGGWYFGSIFIFLCWTGLMHGLEYYHLLQSEHRIMLQAEAEAKEEQLKRTIAQTMAREAHIKMLRYQLNPHFLCNTLNAINALVETEDTERAQMMTVKLSRFLRHSLDNNPDTMITLGSEVKALHLYLDIEKARFGDRLHLVFDVSDKAARGLVPSLLLQPIIENSMKHAISKNEEGGTIALVAKVVGDRLIMQLSDTGAGGKIESSKLKSMRGRGVGLRNTDERLRILFGTDYDINLQLMPKGGLKTTITIPYQTE